MRVELKERLTNLLGERVRFAAPLARHTSFRVGGPADVLAQPNTPRELTALVALLHAEAVPFFLLGGGTNILVSDKGVRGIVIKLGEGFNYVHWRETEEAARVAVGAARALGRFVREAVTNGYGGVEFAEGIPGSVGGGLLMNAGAFGGELSRVVTAITGVCRDGSLVCVTKDQLGFAYRQTALPPGLIVMEVAFCLRREQPEILATVMSHAQRKRQQTQPHGYPNAGSIFKNPPGAYAGRLIEAAGLKGLSQGRAQVSEHHANFIVNTGGATATEVHQLMQQIQQGVWDKYQVWLEPEIHLVGEWERPNAERGMRNAER